MNELACNAIMVAALVITLVVIGVLVWGALASLVVGFVKKDLAESEKVWENKNRNEPAEKKIPEDDLRRSWGDVSDCRSSGGEGKGTGNRCPEP